MCFFNENSPSSYTPRSRTTVAGSMMSFPIRRMRSKLHLFKLCFVPNQITSVCNGFSWSRLDEHHLWMASMHCYRVWNLWIRMRRWWCVCASSAERHQRTDADQAGNCRWFQPILLCRRCILLGPAPTLVAHCSQLCKVQTAVCCEDRWYKVMLLISLTKWLMT